MFIDHLLAPITIAIAPLLLLKGAAALVALVAAPFAVKAMTKPNSRFVYTANVPPEELVGRVVVTDVNVVTETFGRAFLTLDAQEHVLQVRTTGEEISPRGTRVRLDKFVEDQGVFLVSRVDETVDEN